MDVVETKTDVETLLVLNVYNTIAKHFDKTRYYQWEWVTKFINNIPKESLIYDIGCGNGRNMLYTNYNFKGIDNSIEFVKICQEKNLDVTLSDMTSISFPNESSNYAISIASFHHLSTNERRIKCLKEIYRILKPGGLLLLSVWSKTQPKKTKRSFANYGDNYIPWKHSRSVDEFKIKTQIRYYYIFELEEIRELFGKTGFNVVKHEWDCGNEIFTLQKI